MRRFYFFIALMFSQCSYGQWFDNIAAFTTQDGLSNNTITALKKDDLGFLWIGTHEGLNRYDGTEFINVLSNEKNNLPSNNITRLCFINKELMVIGTDAGLCFLNPANLAGKKIELPFVAGFASSGNIIQDLLYKKETKELWVATWHGVFVLNETGVVKKKIMSAGNEMNNAYAIFLFTDKQKDVYFFSQQRAGFYYPEFEKNELITLEKKFSGFPLNDFTKKGYTLRGATVPGNEFTCVFSKSFTQAGDEEYLCYYNTATGKNFIHKLNSSAGSEKRFSNAYPLNDSVFLLNSYFGEPFIYNSINHEIKPASNHPLWFTSWPDGLGASLYKDSNNTWIATSKGLLQSSSQTNFFKMNPALVKQVSEHTSLVTYNHALYANDKFWVACLGAGLFGLDTARNTVEEIFDTKKQSVFSRKIISTDIVSAGNALWLFSIYGPAQVNPFTKQISLADGINKDEKFDDYAAYPLKDSKENIWASLPNGIAKYNIATATFTNYKTRYIGGIFPLMKAGPKAEDAQGNIWMVRQDTLVKFDAAKQSFSTSIISKKGRSLRPVTSMASDGADLLYLSVAGAFAIYHISTGDVDLFMKQTGIISTAINDIATDQFGNAWVATEGGLVYYNKVKMKFSSFTKADGLPDNNITGLNFVDNSKKILFLGFEKTYCLFESQDFLLEKSVPINVITGVEVNGELIAGNMTHDFSYKQNSITFTYTGINYNQGQQNNYACMLEGFDQDWKYPGTERSVNYLNLMPGKYTFKVKSANHQGEWNENPAIFIFEIEPPFWQRWWFRSMIICFAVFSIYYFIKRREGSMQRENNLKLQMSELRMQALRAQMNPHFIFNSLNSIQNYILSNNTIDAAGYLSKFAKLMRRILDQSKHNFLPLGEVLETLKMYVEIEAFRFNNEFTYAFDIDEDDELLDARVPPMLLQPFVENAILHGLMPKSGSKKLFVSSKLVKSNIEIIIDDNGIGRTQHIAKAGHESQGEKLTAGMLESLQQIQNIKASMEIIDKTENNAPSGTTIKFILPLK